jgi:hypothetical protein
VGGVIQPNLLIPPMVQLGLDNGTLRITGGIAREVANGRIFKHLKEIPLPEKDAAGAMSSAARMRLNPKIAIPIGLVVTAVAGGATYFAKKRKHAEVAPAVIEVPECVISFEESLRAYAYAGRAGNLDVEIVTQLITDLDAVKAYRDGGNEVHFSLDQLEPLFALVIGHTPTLAEAYSVEVDDLQDEEPSPESDTVMYLRRHLEAQRHILESAA